jgi:teichuronic acid biosynthesis glycosyltransferase TuaH
VAQEKPEWSLVLIGPINDEFSDTPQWNQLLALTNVHYLNQKSPQEIPDYMKGLDVGLLPYADAEFNLGVFPLKLFEYLAAGLPVVGCGLPSTSDYIEDNVYYYSLVHDFEAMCVKAIEQNTPVGKSRRLEMAREADWSGKFQSIYRFVLS